MNRQTLTLLVATCFILLAFSPMSSNAEENLQNVLVEVNGEKYPVELSEEDLETIDEIVFSLQNQLQDVTDKEQATQLLQEALTELDNLGLLQGISVESLTQQIMRGVLIADNHDSVFQNQLSENNSTINATCSLITGNFSVSHNDAFLAASTTVRVTLILLALLIAPLAGVSWIPFFLLYYIIDIFDLNGSQFLWQLADYFFDFGAFFLAPVVFAIMYSIYFPCIRTGLLLPLLNPHTISTMTFGYEFTHGSNFNGWYPSGFITSIGLNKQTINGEFKGDLPNHFEYSGYPSEPVNKWFSGIYGFTGISLKSGQNYYIIGNGLMTSLVEVQQKLKE